MIATKRPEPKNIPSGIVRTFGDLRFRTDGDLLALAFGGDGALLSIEEPGMLRRWQVTGQQIGNQALSDLETLWSFSSDGRVLASASDDVSLWKVASGKLLTAFAQPSWVTALALSADARYLATGHDDGVARLWEVGKRRLLREFAGHELPVSAVAFDPAGKRLASAGEDKVVVLWDIEADDALGRLEGHTDRIQTLRWHPDGRRLISAGWDGSARVWDTLIQETALLLNYHAAQLTALAIDPDGLVVASADSEDLIYIYDLKAGTLRGRLEGHRGPVSCLAFSRDGRQLASGGAERLIRLWDPERAGDAPLSRSAPQELGSFSGTGMNMVLSTDGKRLASASGTSLQIWNAETGQAIVQSDQESTVGALAFSPDGKSLAGGMASASILFWDSASGLVRWALSDEDQIAAVTALAFSPDGARLASASATGLEVWLWHVARQEPCLLIPDAIGGCAIEALAFHPRRPLLAVGGIDWLATGGSDGAVCLWNVKERCEIATFDGGSTALAFDPTGAQLASASLARSICVWDIESRGLALELIGHDDMVTCLAYSPDGRLIASGSDDRSVRLWDSTTGKLLVTASLNTQVKAAAFSPDGRFVYTGNANMTCYQLDTRAILARHSGS